MLNITYSIPLLITDVPLINFNSVRLLPHCIDDYRLLTRLKTVAFQVVDFLHSKKEETRKERRVKGEHKMLQIVQKWWNTTLNWGKRSEILWRIKLTDGLLRKLWHSIIFFCACKYSRRLCIWVILISDIVQHDTVTSSLSNTHTPVFFSLFLMLWCSSESEL